MIGWLKSFIRGSTGSVTERFHVTPDTPSVDIDKKPPCRHNGGLLERVDEILTDGVWKPSSIYRACKDCNKVVEVKTFSRAFMTEDALRRKGEWKEL